MIFARYLEIMDKWYHGIHLKKDGVNIRIKDLIEKNLGLTFVPESEAAGNVCMIQSPEIRDCYKEIFTHRDLLDYSYAVLFSPSYREMFKEFLTIDFQGFPPPKNIESFWSLVAIGRELRQLHLLQSPKVEDFITSFPIEGHNAITRTIGIKDWEGVSSKTIQRGVYGRIWINEIQYFDNIPLVAWELYLSGDRPAQKWLKFHRGQILDFEDIRHYQKIIVSLTETHRLMQEIDINALTTLQ